MQQVYESFIEVASVIDPDQRLGISRSFLLLSCLTTVNQIFQDAQEMGECSLGIVQMQKF